MKKTMTPLLAACAAVAVAASLAQEPQLYMAGDSIMADYKSDMFPQMGWGQALRAFMKEPSALHNLARSGWSARRFRESGRWEGCIASKLKAGDWVIASFAHNDSNKRRNKPPKNDYSTPEEYKAFLAGFVADVRAKGANIAFTTCVPHSDGFCEKDGAMTVDGGATGLAPYRQALRELCAEKGVPLLDINKHAEEEFPKMGMEKSLALYMRVKPGECPNYPKGKDDHAHIRDAGAHWFAKAAVTLAKRQGLGLANLFKEPESVSIAPYAKFADGMLSKTRPAGWLARACKTQSEGLTGHPEALSYPYDTCLWAGEIPRMGKHGSDWWRYEQTAYYTDGLLRMGYATGDAAFVKKGEAGVDYTLDHVSPDGYLGHPSLWDVKNKKYKIKNGYDMWPMAVFFRAMKAKYDETGDERIPAALARYFLKYDAKHVSQFRNIVNVEGILWTYARTGDRKLLDLAEKAWNMRKPMPPNKKNELAPENCANDDAIHMHGVSYCEEMKVPIILAAYTGKREYLDQAVNVERKLVRDHMLPDGCPSSTERVRGNNAHWGHETCDVADYTWTLGYFVEATGDGSYADKIERCVFNAGFGCVADDFKSLQYFSTPNQFICTSNSDHNPHNYGTTWMQYRPTHETECCAGNVHRILPDYISLMWLKDAEGRPVAALYGPSEVDYGWAKIKEETRYPFDGKIVFRFSVKEAKDSAFTYRVPGWCRKGATVKVNGESVAAGECGKFATIARRFADGDVVELNFPMETSFETLEKRFVIDNKGGKRGLKRPADRFANASQGTVVTRGPLVFALPIAEDRVEDKEDHANMNGKKSGNPDFKCWNLRPASPFNYALAAHRAEVVETHDESQDGFYGRVASVKLRVPVRRVEWELFEDRFTPDMPEKPVVLPGDEETVELVPYGTTMLRLGVFPDLASADGRDEGRKD